MRTLALACCFLLAVAAPLHAQQAIPPTGDPLLDEFITAAGMQHCMGIKPQVIDSSVARVRDKMTEAQFAWVSRAMRYAFDYTAMQTAGVNRLRQVLHPDSSRAAIAWLTSPLGKRIVDSESAAASEGAAALEAFASKVDVEDAATIERIQVAKQILDEMNGLELAIDSFAGVGEAVVYGMQRTMMPSEQISGVDRAEIVKSLRASMGEQILGVLLLNMLFTYRDLSTDDLRAYRDFLASPVGGWYHRATYAASSASLAAARSRVEVFAEPIP